MKQEHKPAKKLKQQKVKLCFTEYQDSLYM